MNDVMKKRVIGAVVLVILGVLLPLLLARCLHGDAADRSASMRVYEVSPDGQATPADGSARQAAEAGTSDGQGSTGKTSGNADADIDGSSGVPEPEPTQSMPQAVSPSAQASTDEADDDESFQTPAVQGNASGSASTPPETPSSSANSQTSSSSSSSGATSLRKTTTQEGGWVVQVASFGDEKNAQRLAEQLNGDYRAFYRAGEVSGKTWYRVRIGPFDSESQARTIAAKLRQQGRATLVQRAE